MGLASDRGRVELHSRTGSTSPPLSVAKSPLVFGDEFLAQGLHLQSHQRCSAGIRTWFYADQSSSSTLTESIIFFLNLALYTEALSC